MIQDKTQILNPKGFFYAVMSLMKNLSHQPWDDFISMDRWISHSAICNSGVCAKIHPNGPNLLRFSHAVPGLYQAAIDALQEPLFYGFEAEWKLRSALVGSMQVIKARWTPFTKFVPASNLTADLSGETGTVIDPVNDGYKIDYKFDGTKLNSKDIFAAILDALATAAPHDKNSDCQNLLGVGPPSRTGQVVVSIHQVPSAHPMSYNTATSALYAIFTKLNVDQNKWGEMTFDVLREAEKVGQGDVFGLGPL